MSGGVGMDIKKLVDGHGEVGVFGSTLLLQNLPAE
jgi:hypothetical protein